MTFLEKLEPILNNTIAPAAISTDCNAAFPRAAIDALGKAGLLGLISAIEVGGMELTIAEAAQLVERIAMVCPSTAMVVTMHYCGTAVLEKLGSESIRRAAASGRHLTTLAWSETGSRSHFWAPVGTARRDGDAYVLDGAKTMVTSAGQVDSYIWSSRPAEAAGASTLWFIDARAEGLSIPKPYDGMGLRGNCSSPLSCAAMRVSRAAMLGEDGGGFDAMINVVLPLFSVLIASGSIGMMEAALGGAIAHVGNSRLEHLDSALSGLPTIRSYIARARIRTDATRTLRDDTLGALAGNRPDAMLRVMEVKAAAAEAALDVTDIAMRVCGGAAFRKEAGIERFFRDARAAAVMAPTSDALFDFIGRAVCGLPVFG